MNPTGRRPFLASISGLANLSIAAQAAQLASGQHGETLKESKLFL
jgi:hypothetical protein